MPGMSLGEVSPCVRVVGLSLTTTRCFTRMSPPAVGVVSAPVWARARLGAIMGVDCDVAREALSARLDGERESRSLRFGSMSTWKRAVSAVPGTSWLTTRSVGCGGQRSPSLTRVRPQLLWRPRA